MRYPEFLKEKGTIALLPRPLAAKSSPTGRHLTMPEKAVSSGLLWIWGRTATPERE